MRCWMGSNGREPAVMRVGYSMPSAPEASSGVSITVSVGYGYLKNHSSLQRRAFSTARRCRWKLPRLRSAA